MYSFLSTPARKFTTLASLLLLLAGPAAAQLSDADRQALVDFYHSTSGESWINNDGWLDPGVEPCDWHGVDCSFRFEADRDVIRHLDLPANNLTGSLPDGRIFSVVFERIDLSGNHIGGSLEMLPGSPSIVDLSGNQLEGELPTQQAEPGGGPEISIPNELWRLDLSGNRLQGEVPESWSEFRIHWLDLADNRLEGVPEALFRRIDHPLGPLARYINLAGNRFAGELPGALMQADLAAHNGELAGRWGGGVNLCWNELEVDDPELEQWLGNHHVGGADFGNCLARERSTIDAGVSGSWFDPSRSGEGVVVHLLDSGKPLLYWFTYDDEGKQRWLLEVGTTGERHLRWRELVQTRGRFSQGLSPQDPDAKEVRGSFRFDRLGADLAQVERIYIESLGNPCFSVPPPRLGCFGDSVSDRLDYMRLTRLAGTTCDNQHPRQWISGSWFDPQRDGEGFVVEVLEDGRAVVYWFTHTPDESGAQAWMVGVGEFSGDTLVVDELVQPLGARFGDGFDPGDVDRVPWGTVSLEFFDDESGRVSWDSELDGFGAGEHQLVRLSRVSMAECPPG